MASGDFAEDIIEYLQENLEFFASATRDQANNLWEELAATLSIKYQTTYEALKLRTSWLIMRSRALKKDESRPGGQKVPLTPREQEIVELAAALECQRGEVESGQAGRVSLMKVDSIENHSTTAERAAPSGEVYAYGKGEGKKRPLTEEEECKDVILESFNELHEKRIASIAMKKKRKREMHAKKMECLEAKVRQDAERHEKLLELHEMEVQQKQALYEMEMKHKNELFKLRKKQMEVDVAMAVLDS